MKSKKDSHLVALLKSSAADKEDTVVLNYLHETKEIFRKNPRAAITTFISKGFESKAVQAMKDLVIEKIVKCITETCNGKFGILIDATTDVAFENKCSIVIRYVTPNFEIHERTIAFVTAIKSSGEAMYELMKNALENVGLDPKNIVGACTDGASNMLSIAVGVYAHLKNISPLSIITWCASHRYNLVVQGACNDLSSALLKYVNSIAVIMRNSSKRMKDYRQIVTSINKLYKEIRTSIRPKNIQETRWSSRQRALNSIMQNVSRFLVVFISVHNAYKCPDLQPKSKDTQKLLGDILEFLSDSGNVALAFVLNVIFTRLQITTALLQTSGLQLSEVVPIIGSCYRYLNSLIEEDDAKILSILTEANKFITTARERLNTDVITVLFKNLDDQSIFLKEYDTKIVVEIVRNFVLSAMKNIQLRFLDEFNSNLNFYDELTSLSPSKLQEFILGDELSLATLCNYVGIDNQKAVSQLQELALEYQQCLRNKQNATNELDALQAEDILSGLSIRDD